MNHIRNPKMFDAAFALIQSCVHNEQYEDALLYAHTAHEMVSNDADGIIPSGQREPLLAEGSHWLASTTFNLAESGGIPPEEKHKAGEKAIALAHQALEIYTQLHGTESVKVARDMHTVADVLHYFNDVDDEVLRLHEQSIEIISRFEGRTSVNMAIVKENLGNAYDRSASRAKAANDCDRCMANLERALTDFREAARIYRAVNHVDKAERLLRYVIEVEEKMEQI